MSYGQVNKQNGDIIPYAGSAIKVFPNASQVPYDNTDSELEATDVQDAIDELKTNFQAGVDSVYNAIVAKGTTPASKSLSDVIQGIADIETATVHTETYTASSRSSNLDMGESHEYRYIDTTNVPNSNSGTYTYPSGSTGGTVDMLADNTYRYVNADNVYAKGKEDAPRQEKSCTPSTSAQTVNPDSGYLLSKVNVAAIPNLHTSNSMIVPRWGTSPGSTVPATTVATRNPRVDFKNSTTYGNAEMIEVAMPEGYYAWSWGNSSCCIPTETKTVTAGTSATTVTPSNYNSGGNYLKYLKSVTINPTPSQEKSITSSRSAQTVTPDSGKLLSKVTVAKYPDASGTYTASSRGSALDMGATNNLRYVNTNGVPNSNSGTYTYGSGSTGGTVDLGATNSYRYVNASNVYSKGVSDADGRANPSSTNWKAGQTNGLENCKFINRFWTMGADAVGDYSYTFPKTGYYVAFTLSVAMPRFSGSVSSYNASDIGNGWWCSWWWAAAGASMTITKPQGGAFLLAGRE